MTDVFTATSQQRRTLSQWGYFLRRDRQRDQPGSFWHRSGVAALWRFRRRWHDRCFRRDPAARWFNPMVVFQRRGRQLHQPGDHHRALLGTAIRRLRRRRQDRRPCRAAPERWRPASRLLAARAWSGRHLGPHPGACPRAASGRFQRRWHLRLDGAALRNEGAAGFRSAANIGARQVTAPFIIP